MASVFFALHKTTILLLRYSMTAADPLARTLGLGCRNVLPESSKARSAGRRDNSGGTLNQRKWIFILRGWNRDRTNGPSYNSRQGRGTFFFFFVLFFLLFLLLALVLLLLLVFSFYSNFSSPTFSSSFSFFSSYTFSNFSSSCFSSTCF